jgi:hypothetical protein
MSIKTGRYGLVSWDPTGGTTAAPLIAINGWKLSQKTNYEDVTCFQDPNLVYVPGLKDVSGSLAGFWDSANTEIFDAVDSPTPGLLELMPNNTEPLVLWKGLAYLDADIDCTVKGAPKVASNFKAAAAWTPPPSAP